MHTNLHESIREDSYRFVSTWVPMLFCWIALAAGCASSMPAKAPATMPSNATRVPAYWFDRPGVASVSAADFELLWRAAEEAARDFGFRPDRLDFRDGVITTDPLVSKQWFEFWRNDVATVDDLAESSLATHRRTLRFDIEASGDRFVATPRVVVERFAQAERPVTSSIYLRNAFRSQKLRDRAYGTPESDRGILLPRQYWYATGRDEALERNVASALEKRVRQSS